MSGGIAAALTTPLDVAKTRIMLAKRSHEGDLARGNMRIALALVFKEKGVSG
jgi:solute carrier family 25 S-adenosylmethionine transporter 26